MGPNICVMGERKEKIETKMCVFRGSCGHTPKTRCGHTPKTVQDEKHDRQDQWGMTGQEGNGDAGCVGVSVGVLLLLLLLFYCCFCCCFTDLQGVQGMR